MHTIRSVYWLVHKVCLLLTKITLVQCSCEQLAKLVDTVKVHQYHKVSTGFSQHTVCRSQIKSSQKLGKTKPTFYCYVFSSGGASCMVTAVDPLLVLNCSKRFSSTLLSSARGRWKVLSKAGLELPIPPDTEGIHKSFLGTLLWPKDGLIFWRGLEPVAPRTLDTWVRLATSRRWSCNDKNPISYFSYLW